MEKLRDETISNIRAVLISIKGKCEASQLNRDYRLLMGSEIPYRKLGCSSLEEFVRTIPSLTISKLPSGVVLIDAKATEKTAHIVEMVQRQRTAKRRPPKYVTKHNYSASPGKWRPKNVSNKWKTTYQNSPRPAAVSHNQFVNIPRPVTYYPAPANQKPPSASMNNNNDYHQQQPSNIGHTKSATDLRHKLDAKKLSEPDLRIKLDLMRYNSEPGSKISNNGTRNHTTASSKPLGEDPNGESDSSGSSIEKVPHSIKTNRANLMKNKPTPVTISPSPITISPLPMNISPLPITLSPLPMTFSPSPITTYSSPITLNPLLITNPSPENVVIKQRSTNISPSVESLKIEAMAALDFKSSIWNWNSSDTDSDSRNGKQEEPFQLTGAPVADLITFCKYKKLPDPIFKSTKRQTKPHKPTYYDFTVRIGGSHVFSSYPADFTDMDAAKNKVAQLAVDALMVFYEKAKSMLLSEEADILKRIPPIVEKHFNGVWSSQLEADYKDLFHEQLPENWLQIIDMCPKMSVTRLDTKYVLRYCRPEDKGKTAFMTVVQDVSIPASTVEFTDNGYLLAEITCVVSGKEIWCRQVDTPQSEAYDNMMLALEKYYNQGLQSSRALTVSPGSYYAAFIDLSWYRVRILGVNENIAHCLLLDRGDDQKVTVDKLFQLPREFAKEQAQAFICRLAGLEELYEVSENSQHLLNLEGLIVHLEPFEDESKIDKYEPICVCLYDLETGDSINQTLISLISIENALPQLNENGPNEVYITHIESNGDIYVQQHSLGYEKLESLIADLETSITELAPILPYDPITYENSKDRLFFAQYKKDNHWYRTRIIDWSPCRTYAQIYFVDYGDTDVIKISNAVLYPLEEISSVVAKFPEQAIKVRMHMDKVPQKFEEKIRAMASEETEVLMVIVETDNVNVPRCRFFTRVSNVGLVSINDSISIDLLDECEKDVLIKPEKLEKLHLLDSEISAKAIVPSSGNLKNPPLPEVGSFFDVKIPFAVNPWNFFVQPYDSYDKLTALMTVLQNKYADIQYSPLHIDDIMEGNIYASKQEGIWYRTSVIKIINPGCISVFYCDFGYYATLRLEELIPMDLTLLTLPFQAIKAKLAGIKPKQNKWTMDDCKYFQKQVLKKTFVSILSSIEKDELYQCDTVLNLKLIDTSTDSDIDIEDLLVRKKIAVTV